MVNNVYETMVPEIMNQANSNNSAEFIKDVQVTHYTTNCEWLTRIDNLIWKMNARRVLKWSYNYSVEVVVTLTSGRKYKGCYFVLQQKDSADISIHVDGDDALVIQQVYEHEKEEFLDTLSVNPRTMVELINEAVRKAIHVAAYDWYKSHYSN